MNSLPIDLARLLWLSTLIGVALWAPAAIATRRWLPPVAAILEQLVATLAIVTLAVSMLSPARLLNPIMLAGAYLLWPICRWVFGHRHSLAAEVVAVTRRAALAVAIKFERGAGLENEIRGSIATMPRRLGGDSETLHELASPAAAVVVMAVGVTVMPKLVVALANMRLATPEAYSELLIAQRLFAGDLPWQQPSVAAGVTTALSVISAIAPVHLVRLLTPVAAGIALLLMAALLRTMTASRAPAVVAALAGAVFATGVSATLADAAGAAVLLLTIYFLHQVIVQSQYRGEAVVCAILLFLSAPALLIVAAAAAAATLLMPSATLLAAGASWVVVAAMLPAGAPFGWALLAAGAVHLAEQRFEFARPPIRTAFAAAVAALALAVMIPRASAAHYVEYDAAARQTLRIAGEFPKYKWLIAAPVEEWPLSYGRGWHMNLHEFVEDVAPRIDDETFHLPYQVDELFVFVETRPFATFAAEPEDVPFSALIDPVYRHYRSPAGRASLQYAALKLCERLRERQVPSSIFYEDGRLKIYRFTLR